MKKTLCAFLFVLILPMANAFAACATNEIDVLGDGTQCETAKFTVTTTSDATSLSWTMSATGEFYADCGDSGILSQDTSSYGTISGTQITRTGTSQTTYTCTWDTAGVHTVRFGGGATGYGALTTIAAISFYKSSGGTQARVASIDGSLGAMFPVINGTIPSFYYTFNGTQITSIPTGLFSGINTSSATDTRYMFTSTFSSTKITSIPTGLFSGINTSSATNTSYMFDSTFSKTQITTIPTGLFDAIDTSSATNTSSMFGGTFSNTQITTIPSGLFDAINTSSATNTIQMFWGTFSNTQITSIPTGLFSGINTSSATNTRYMFTSTFDSTKITSIPSDLFSGINTLSATNTSYMFDGTFYGTKITSIPSGLFDAIDTSSATNTIQMFSNTFYGTKITSIPSDLFSGINTSSATNTSRMFNQTFDNCTSLTGYIPPTAFPNTIRPGSSSSSSMWYRTFYNTQLATSCPAGTVEYNTGFQNDWGYSNSNTTTSGTYRVSCEPCGTLPANATWITGTCNFTCDNGYHPERELDLNTLIGTTTSTDSGRIEIWNEVGWNSGTYGLTEAGEFAVTYADNKGIIKGRAECNTAQGYRDTVNNNNSNWNDPTTYESLPGLTGGRYCYCRLDEYTPVNGSSVSLSGPWVFYLDQGSGCEETCAASCDTAMSSASGYDFRSIVFGSVGGDTAATCEPNIITVNWSNASAADIAANEAGTVTYGGDIRTPRAATIIPGKVFLGWKFSAPEPEPDQ